MRMRLHFLVLAAFLGDTLRFQLDLGSSSISLSSRYFKEHKETITAHYPAVPSHIGGLGGVKDYVKYVVPDPDIIIGDAHFKGELICIDSVNLGEIGNTYGRIGNDFLLFFDKAVINLRKMFLYVGSPGDNSW